MKRHVKKEGKEEREREREREREYVFGREVHFYNYALQPSLQGSVRLFVIYKIQLTLKANLKKDMCKEFLLRITFFDVSLHPSFLPSFLPSLTPAWDQKHRLQCDYKDPLNAEN